MCDQTTQNLIAEVVEQFTDEDRLFTALDISKEVQERLKADGQFDFQSHRHKAIKNDIHRQLRTYVDNGLYHQELQDVGAPTKAFVYYPDGGDPNSYVSIARKDSQVTPSSATVDSTVGTPVVNQSTSDDDEGDEKDSGRTPDARGTLCVPAILLRASGFAFRDVAYLSRNGNDSVLILSKQVPAGATSLSHYTVDHSNNVRVTKANLDHIDQGNGFDFECVNDRILIRANNRQN